MEGFLEEEVQGGPLGSDWTGEGLCFPGRGTWTKARRHSAGPPLIAPLLKAYAWLNSHLSPPAT